MKKAVTGHRGAIGSELVNRGYIPIKSNILDEGLVSEVESIDPDVIVHCAAITDVEYCEDNDREAFTTNVRGTVSVADSFDGLLVYLSTCHVFSGRHYHAYRESHNPNPVNVYGMTKYMGETMCKSGIRGAEGFIVRSSTLFNEEDISPIVERLSSGENVEVSDLIVRSFMYLPHFVEALDQTIEMKLNGDITEELIHVAGNYTESYYGFYQQIARVFDLDNDLFIPRRVEKPELAPRPLRAGLNVDRASGYGIKLRSSHEGLWEIKGE